MAKQDTSKTQKGLTEGLVVQRMPRRTMLHKMAHGVVHLSLAGLTLGFFRFFFPRVLFEKPLKFQVGTPDQFQMGTISTKYQKEHRVWVARTDEGIYVLSTICTHLGCTPRWLTGEDKFKCPCHGSGFTREGINYEGPAPRPLERFNVTLAGNGQIEVDKARVFRHERGEWDKDGAFLKLG